MVDAQWRNLCQMFFAQAKKYGDQPFLWRKKTDKYEATSWAEAANIVAKLSQALKDKGVEKGDRVLLVCESRPEWCLSDLAIMAAGAITVPAYTTNTYRDHLHILENSSAKGAILSTKALAKSFLPAAHQSDALQFVIMMEDPVISQELTPKIYQWDTVIGESNGTLEEVETASAAFERDDLACLIYTSGTGGAPKGVKLHHGAILHNCEGAKEVVDELNARHHRFLSFLPLSHAYEHSAGQFLPIYLGAEIYYAQGLDKLSTNFLEARPTIMTVVPRLFELLKTKIVKGINEQGALQQKMFQQAVELGEKRLLGTESVADKVANAALDVLVRRKVRAKFGGEIEALISGGAALNPAVGVFFAALGLPLLQGYGQTESAPVVSVNRPSQTKMETVGPPLKNTQIKIAGDGEILLKGEMVMQGYWHNNEATRAVIRDGWLHTGDIGEIDDDGHVKITDRKKDIIVNDKGDNVSPQRIEGILSLEPEISQAMIFGEGKPHLVALIVPDADWLRDWAAHNGKESAALGDLYQDKDLKKAIDAAVQRVNAEVSNLEKVRRFIVADEAFTIENERLTPTMKIRRHVILIKYAGMLEALY